MLTNQLLPPAEAVEYFRQKGYQLSFAWEDITAQMHRQAFTVAKVMEMDILQDIRSAVDIALSDGKSFADFKKELEPTLKAKGWWGKGLMEDPLDNDLKEVQLGSPRRLKVIYNTNLATAHSEGQWARVQDRKAAFPYLIYDANNSETPREEHSAWDKLVFRVDDPWVERHFPKKEFGCKCRMRSASQRMLERQGLQVQEGGDDTFINQNGTIKKVPEKYRTVLNNRTGQTQKVPFGVHPAFNFPSGQGWYDNLEQYAAGRLDTLPPALQRALGRIVTTPLPPLVKPTVPVATAASFFDELEEIPNTQKGSMPGGIYTASDGAQYYVKFYPNEEHARMEYAANLIYKELGIPVPELRIGEMLAPDGKKKLALVSRWEEGLEKLSPEELAKNEKELARIFASSVLLKNWDMVGLGYDNLLFKNGKLMLVDTGASFKYRAQGGAKAFESDKIDEVQTFLDGRINPQSAAVFREAFKNDVFLEAEGAKILLKLSDKRVRELLEQSGLDKKTVDELAKGIAGRRKLLIERYDLRGKRTYKSFGTHLKAFKKWDRSRYETQTAPNGAVYSKQAEKDVLDLVTQFESYVNKNIHPNGKTALKRIFADWSGDSSADLSALMKKWAEDRFNAKTTFHRNSIDYSLSSGESELARLGIDKETAFKLLDAEYEFHQYYLKRIHGWEDVVVERGMSPEEYESMYKDGVYQFNSVSSTQTKPSGNFAHKGWRLRYRLKTEDVLKSWYQGGSYLSFYKQELEYIVLGGKRAAEDLSTAVKGR